MLRFLFVVFVVIVTGRKKEKEKEKVKRPTSFFFSRSFFHFLSLVSLPTTRKRIGIEIVVLQNPKKATRKRF